MAKLTPEQAEVALTEWKEAIDRLTEERDDIVRQADRAGIAINRIYTLTGIARSTIYRILDRQPRSTTRRTPRKRSTARAR